MPKTAANVQKQSLAAVATAQVPDKKDSTQEEEKPKPKPEEDSFDMFSLDKFSALKSAAGTGDDTHEELEENATLADNWDDKEGYYRERVGEKLCEGRYHVLGGRGKGVFSTVLFCRNTRRQGRIRHEHVACIRITAKDIRVNDLITFESRKG